ncbi:ABC transporter ATP-binding protein [Singulisphaera acidiphila]|uniref:ABC-type multidrug transport system, ATPase and permease component n=1 Tax=Singulisphaera acidiphila (strain ATCC BAA-1392 / DSM 18658 / VKM B-2454 / MOB10) TaxID=886293 RepID=L0DI25_SINAD|nr:ABC transporter ATP-binding protein [Singulisphaera acidiphila]AGA28892.1 ABC-type multidrug transport system, ATPase and permease component [Singulisphaera acidiphila DSM 18658]
MALHHRLTSRLRFLRYRDEWSNRTQDKARPGTGEATPRHRSLPRLYRELYTLLEGQRSAVALALATLSIATLLRLVPPAATKLVIDYVLLAKPLPGSLPAWLPIPAAPKGRLLALVTGVFLVSVVSTACGLWGRWRATLASKRIQVKVRRQVFEHAVRLPLHRVYQLKSGGAASLLREDAGGVGELIFSMIYNPWRALVQLLGGLIVLCWVDWRLLLGAGALGPALYWTDRLWNRRLRPLFRDVRKQRQEIDAMAAEAFGGMRVVRAFGRQRRESARFVGENHFMSRQELFAWRWSRGVEILWDLLLPASSGLLLLYGGIRVLDGRLSLGDLMMFLVYLAMLLEPLAVLATSVTQLQNNLSGLDRVLDLMEEPREMVSNAGTWSIAKSSVAGRIQFDEVSFAYPNTETSVLRDINLEVEAGEVIALVGRSGAGKTTLCNLIARFYDPTAGVVRLDGTNLRDLKVESYRRLLGIVEQDVFLFDGTIGENIAYADRRATLAQVEHAARVANAAEFITRLPDGYDTLIGERGVRLSGGQRQRLAIARAVLADPRIFILDEATSNLDSESEHLIQQSLTTLMRGRTSFVIAHRLSTIRHADRILVMEGGAIAQVGSHAELMADSGLYRDMVLLQRLETTSS